MAQIDSVKEEAYNAIRGEISGRSYTVVIAHSDPEICRDLHKGLLRQGHKVLIAYDADACLRMCNMAKPDLILLNSILPSASGLTLCSLLRQQTSVPILLLAASEGYLDGPFAYKLGADAWIEKSVSTQEVLSRVTLYLCGIGSRTEAPVNKVIPPPVAPIPLLKRICVGNLILLPSQYAIIVDQKQIHLTMSEFRLLQFLAERAGQPTEHEAIQRHLHESREAPTYGSLAMLVRRIRSKIEENPSHPRYLLSSYGQGYLLRGE